MLAPALPRPLDTEAPPHDAEREAIQRFVLGTEPPRVLIGDCEATTARIRDTRVRLMWWRQPFGQLAVRVIQISRDQTP